MTSLFSETSQQAQGIGPAEEFLYAADTQFGAAADGADGQAGLQPEP